MVIGFSAFPQEINKNCLFHDKMKILMLMLILLLVFPYISSAANDSCDYSIQIMLNGSEFNETNFQWRMKTEKIEGIPTNITGTAEITDLSGNLVKSYKPWTNAAISKQKTSNIYSPNLKGGSYKLISKINVECDDSDKSNNEDFRIFTIIAGQNYTTLNNGNNLSSAANRYPESINNFNAPSTMDNTVQLLDNSDELYQEPKEIPKQKIKKEHLSINNSKKTSYAGIPASEVVYESSNEKSKELIVFSLLGLSVLLSAVLIWKR